MNKEIRILFVEDLPADVVMVNHALRQGGFDFRLKRVDNLETFVRELDRNPPDVILSDHGLPGFDGFTALAIARKTCPEVPFIFVTSALSEEKTIQTFEQGATGYVLKKDLSRLVQVVERALREAEERKTLRQKERQLRESEERYRRLIEFCPDAFFVERDRQIVYANMAAARLVGAENAEQIVGKPLKEIVHRDSWEALEKRFAQLRDSGTILFWRSIEKGNVPSRREKPAVAPFVEAEFVRRDGSIVEVEVAATPLTLQRRQAVQIIVRDITERKLAAAALQKSEERYRCLVEHSPEAILAIQENQEIAFANPAAAKLLQAAGVQQLVGQRAEPFFPPEALAELIRRVQALPPGQPFTRFQEQQLLGADGTPLEVEISAARTAFRGGPAVQVIARDITERKQSLEKLRRSEAMKTIILETALDAIVFVGADGRIQEWNAAAQKIFGYSREEALGKLMDELIIPAAMWEVYQDGLTNYLMTGVGSLIGRPIELTLRRKDGREFRAEIGITRISSDDPPCCTALIRDITERKQAESFLRQSEERLRLLIENVKDYAIYMLDPEGKVASWNVGAQHIEGYRAEEIIGKPFSTFFTPEDKARGEPRRFLQRAEREGRSVNEGWRVRKDGSRFWSQGLITAMRDEDGTLLGFSKIAHDTTKQKEAEEKIQSLNERLEQRVRDRTAQLEAANQELEAFSYSVSHDLRAPLRHICGYAQILQAEAAAKLADEEREHLQNVADSAQNLGELIDALLAFSRMSRAEMSRRPLSLAALAKEALRELRHETEGRTVEWAIGALPEVQGDALMLRQVFINLLANALKYTRKRGLAKIEVGATDSEEEIVVFVRDNGVGFDMNYASKLFGVFQRLHSPNEFEGIGIGLANVRRIVHRHGGRVWALGKPGTGATFYFSIPKMPKEGS